MPNRILKESICYSEDISKLSWVEEVFFYRLIVNCDDYGRLDARAAILKAKLFPLKDVTTKQIESFLNKLVTVGMVRVYEYDRQPFLQLLTWEKHQQIRAKKSKYPTPDKSQIIIDDELNKYSSEIIGNQMKSDVPVIQSESESKSESEMLPSASATGSSAPPDFVISLVLNDKTEYEIIKNQIVLWAELYPNVDVMQELRNMKGWCIANRAKRKTRSGIESFISRWLSKEQNAGGTKNAKNNTLPESLTSQDYGKEGVCPY